MERLDLRRTVFDDSGTTLRYMRYLDDFPAYPLTNIWDDTSDGQASATTRSTSCRPTPKFVERCMLMTTDPGDLVLDPTCGSGTTAFVAEQWGRRWITIDTSRVALALARQRLMGAQFPYYLLADSAEGRAKESELSATPLPPATPTSDIRHGFVYERVQHITLKSIANNPDIKEGMTRERDRQGDQAARRLRAALRQALRGQEARCGSPDRSRSRACRRTAAWPFATASEPRRASETAAEDPDAPTFEQTVLDNLRAAGVQNGRQGRAPRVRRRRDLRRHPHPGGRRPRGRAGRRARSGSACRSARSTARSRPTSWWTPPARPARTWTSTCCASWASPSSRRCSAANDDYVASDEGFDVAAERSLGRIPVLLVRMNADLLMGEDLKKTGAGNLFTVFGEPDIELREEGDELVVELNGVDVYDPTTGEVRSDATDQVALWMIDTDYDGESFFVRHCYFTGGQDPYKRLKTALKADIDEDAWATLYQTDVPPLPQARHRQDRRQGHQRLRRRGRQGLRGLSERDGGRSSSRADDRRADPSRGQDYLGTSRACLATFEGSTRSSTS